MPTKKRTDCPWRSLDHIAEALAYEDFVSVRISRLAAAIRRSGPYLLPEVGLNVQEWRTVALLSSADSTTAQELSARIDIDKAAFSRTIAGLRARGLVREVRDVQDARRKLVSLTPEGRQLYSALLPHARARQVHILSALSEADRVRLWTILDTLAPSVNSFRSTNNGDRHLAATEVSEKPRISSGRIKKDSEELKVREPRLKAKSHEINA